MPKSKTNPEKNGDLSKLALSYSKYYQGKIQTIPKVPVKSLNDFSIWYTPGVAAVSLAVAKNPDLSFELTNRWNMLCILTDGSRVLGLGDIGPEGSLPVMEGKALIYKYLGGVDAIPVPVNAHEPEKIIEIGTHLEPAFGAIHLEDIASPKCFQILDRLKEKLSIPVWHDDQQGTAGVILAGLYNSLLLTGRTLKDSQIVLMGAGAANIAAARLVISAGARPGNLILVDSKGILHSEREDMDQLMLQNKWKYELALKTNTERKTGGIEDAAKGADALIAASKPGPHVLNRATLSKMNRDAILFALSNPVPEIWPKEAKAAGVRIVATGRSDFPNQVNNSLIFPSIIRGVLDVRSRSISDEVIIVGAKELAAFTQKDGSLNENHILPTMMDWEIFPLVASAVGEECVRLGLSRIKLTRKQIHARSAEIIEKSKKMIEELQKSKLIEALPKMGKSR
ncbi:MAG: NADP-dependent malic enzyme [Thaumarchaeota archaeon]|nr:NADP-dependent malic enzyme [Nitrososphaerota archaeon]